MMIFFSQCYDNYVFFKVLLEHNSEFFASMSDLDDLPFASEVSISEARERIKNRRCQKSLERSGSGEATLLESITCVLSSFFVGTLGVDDFPNFPFGGGICYIVSWRVLLAQKLTYPLNPLKNVGWKTIFSFFEMIPFQVTCWFSGR